ncbi:hypothetical protein ACF3DV_09690 [Chlorogloeopsis fritschii PCC 9212]|uniref:hypothetical protein n=1 Tax=Chlorogloeopsis fritschii TaxID=1124 RepID=UPI00370D9DA7
MEALFCLSPRYRLDDELPWLEGIDPSRHYWITVNGDKNLTVSLPGLTVSSKNELKQAIQQFRSLQPGEQMSLARIAKTCTIHCISSNCYAIEAEIDNAPVWHLFNQETLDSLLMTAHPDWQCAPKDIELGRRLLMQSFQQVAASKS